MNDNMIAAFVRVPELLAQHLLLAASAMLLGLAIALPLAVFAARRPLLARAALGVASLIQTIPALALLALFYPLLLAIATVTGGAVHPLGFLPALLALTLYALLPILRNTIAGLRGIDPAIIEAADGVGMTAWQKLAIIETPLAAPVVMAGVRTAAVWTIGAATLSTTVGQPSLGDLIFAGLQTQNWALVLVGCVVAALLALGVDALLGTIEHGVRHRKRARVLVAAGLIVAGIATAIVPSLDDRRDVVTIGAKGFSEQYILARVIGRRLEAAGYTVRYREGLGSAVIFAALTRGDIDVYVDYSGTIWTNEMKRTTAIARPQMIAEVGRWAKDTHKVSLLGALGFENTYAFAMRKDRARALGIASLADLTAAAPGLVLGADLEFLERPEWPPVRDGYRLRFRALRTFSPTFMYSAVSSGQADVITAFSSDGRIAADRLTVLADPKGAIPGYDAILLAAPARARDERFRAALAPLAGSIPVETMREANYQVDREQDKQSPEAAAAWLDARIARP